MQRRGFILGLSSLIAAPAVVRAESLMKIVMPSRALIIDDPWPLLTPDFVAAETLRLLRSNLVYERIVRASFASDYEASPIRIRTRLAHEGAM